jgi:hypothetical protein
VAKAAAKADPKVSEGSGLTETEAGLRVRQIGGEYGPLSNLGVVTSEGGSQGVRRLFGDRSFAPGEPGGDRTRKPISVEGVGL